MLLSVHFVSTSMSSLERVKKALTKNLKFVVGDSVMSQLNIRFDFVPDSDGDELFECEELIATH